MIRALLVTCMLAAAGCPTPSAQIYVRRQVLPSPITKTTAFVAEEPTFTDVRIGKRSEAEYLWRLSAARRADWERGKAQLRKDFVARFESSSTAPRFVVRAHVYDIDPGRGEVVLRARTSIFDPQGALVDEIDQHCYGTEWAAGDHDSTGARLGSCGLTLSHEVELYLDYRAGRGEPTAVHCFFPGGPFLEYGPNAQVRSAQQPSPESPPPDAKRDK